MILMRAKGPLNFVGPSFEGVEIEYLGTSKGFLALITDGVSRAV